VGSEFAGFDVTVVVLAGGTSRRFGADKLVARWGRGTLLDQAVSGLPSSWSILVVGPERPLSRAVRYAREEPVGAGPAAAVLAGVRACDADRVVTMPGDSPFAAQVVQRLASALVAHQSVVAAGSQPHPLYLGLRATALDRLRGLDPAEWAHRSARALMSWLDPLHVTVPPGWLADVDTPADLDSLVRQVPTG